MPALSNQNDVLTNSDGSSLVGVLAGEMIAEWQAGNRPLAEDFLNRRPELWERLEAALELIAEELSLRDEFGEPIALQELLARFPQWESHVRTLGEWQRAFGAYPTAPRFPSTEQRLGDFKLLGELGRGSHGRVFLATQTSLGDRPVVLKLSSAAGLEHLSLARLQHTHIVPLYSSHEFPELGLRGLCLPYYGGRSLAEILANLAHLPIPKRTGADLLAALLRNHDTTSLLLPTRSPMCDLLAKISYTEAICRIGICIAEALQFAHDRDLLHLDLKPSNVLIASDGMPMLLDFHLAHAPMRSGDPAPLWLGGTSGYMAPELAAAISAVRSAATIQTGVDGRADIYSLGVVLSEMLGRNPKTSESHLSTGLNDIVARCVAVDPAARYSDAGNVANDLRRHLADLPLVGVKNRGLGERWRKWRRRRPYALPTAALAAALLIIAAFCAAQILGQAERARIALQEGEIQLNTGHFSEALESLRRGENNLDYVPFRTDLATRLRQALLRAERGQTALELHVLADRLRPLYCAEEISPNQLKAAESGCRALWDERESIAQRLQGQATSELERAWRADLIDIAVLFAHIHVRCADPNEILPARRQALGVLTQAESLVGQSGGLYWERAIQARALGETEIAEQARRAAGSFPVTSTWERLIIARTRLCAGNFKMAANELDHCLKDEPNSLWANYYRGVCSVHLREFNEAAFYFTACIALAPQNGWCFYRRGVAHYQSGRLNQARNDFDRAQALDPELNISVARIKSQMGRISDNRPETRENQSPNQSLGTAYPSR